jgi:hypothetical protein
MQQERICYNMPKTTAEISDLKAIFLTKDDKAEIYKTLNSNFKWTIGILLTAILSVGITVVSLASVIINKLNPL